MIYIEKCKILEVGQANILGYVEPCMLQKMNLYTNGVLVQDCSNSIANALELLQSCIKPLIDTIWCCYDAVQHDMILHTLL